MTSLSFDRAASFYDDTRTLPDEISARGSGDQAIGADPGTARTADKRLAAKLMRARLADRPRDLSAWVRQLLARPDPNAHEVGLLLLPDVYALQPLYAQRRLLKFADSPSWEVREFAGSVAGHVLDQQFEEFYPVVKKWARHASENVRRAVVIAAMEAAKADRPDRGAKLLRLIEPLMADPARYVRVNLGPFAVSLALLKNYPEATLRWLNAQARKTDENVRWNVAMVWSAVGVLAPAGRAPHHRHVPAHVLVPLARLGIQPLQRQLRIRLEQGETDSKLPEVDAHVARRVGHQRLDQSQQFRPALRPLHFCRFHRGDDDRAPHVLRGVSPPLLQDEVELVEVLVEDAPGDAPRVFAHFPVRAVGVREQLALSVGRLEQVHIGQQHQPYLVRVVAGLLQQLPAPGRQAARSAGAVRSNHPGGQALVGRACRARIGAGGFVAAAACVEREDDCLKVVAQQCGRNLTLKAIRFSGHVSCLL